MELSKVALAAFSEQPDAQAIIISITINSTVMIINTTTSIISMSCFDYYYC